MNHLTGRVRQAEIPPVEMVCRFAPVAQVDFGRVIAGRTDLVRSLREIGDNARAAPLVLIKI